jgi:GNAT superfamily N-acetyltransferase
MRTLRPCRDGEVTEMLDVINAAAQAYRGVIPADRWHEPYMSDATLRAEIASGVELWGCDDGELLAVMGIQRVRDVALIRHAYVRPGVQRGGVGTALLGHLCEQVSGRLLVGTWSAAAWAIEFYLRNGFDLVPPKRARELLLEYWSIPERQVETSVVLEYARPPT